MKSIVLCAALAAFSACAAAQVATPLVVGDFRVHPPLVRSGDHTYFGAGRYPSHAQQGVRGSFMVARSEGSIRNPVQAGIVHAGAGAFNSVVLGVAHGCVYYNLDASDASPNELWRTDGTAAGCVRVDSGTHRSTWIAELGGMAYYTVNTGPNGECALRRAGSQLNGGEHVHHLGQGFSGQSVVIDNRLLFLVRWQDEITFYATDGSVGGLVELARTNYPYGFATFIGQVAGTALFGTINSAGEWGILRTDGTVAGTTFNEGLRVGPSVYPVTEVGVVLNGWLYFTAASDLAPGGQLWRTDGSIAGTDPVFVPERWGVQSYPVRFKNSIVFASQGVDSAGEGTSELWMADGTPDGFRRLHTGHASNYSAVPAFATENSVYTQAGAYAEAYGPVWRTFGERLVTSPFKVHMEGLGPLQVTSFVGAEGENVIVAAGTQLWYVDMDKSRPGSGGGCATGVDARIPLAALALPWLVRRVRQARAAAR